MAFDEYEVRFLDNCDELFEEKLKQNHEMNDYIKHISNNFNIDKDALRRYKDYYHYYGNGWGYREDGTEDPLLVSKGEKFKDRVAPCFRKLLEVVTTCSIFGDYKLLEPYIKSLSDYGIDINIRIPEKEHKAEYDDYISCVDVYQCNICDIADKLRDEKKPEADLKNIISKTNFNTAVTAYNKLKHNKDIKDSLSKISLDSIVDQNFVTNTINYFGYEPAE